MPAAISKIDEKLKDWATETQAAYIDAVNEHGSIHAAAAALGIHQSVVSRGIQRAQNAASVKGYSPDHDMVKPVPDAFIAKGVSTYYDAEGKPRGQWVKSALDDKKLQILIRDGFDAMAEELPRVAPLDGPALTDADLCNVYTLTDSHVGMLAWHKEGGADWDVRIAERVLTGCFERMVIGALPAETCVIAQLGDFLHSDGMLPVTPTSGHVLDQDGRFSKIVQAAIRILRRTVDFALARHKKVVVLMAEGNHDMASSIWLRAMFKALYEHEPRVVVIDSELPYYVYEHGKCMLAWHHGHLKKIAQLPLLFAAQFPRTWGSTTKRYCHTGHRHHVEEQEHSGMSVIQHATLAARDAYAARGGWISERQVTAITYHSTHGQVARNTVTPEMLTPT